MSGRLENSKARNIRLVGLDLDGTVFTDEKTITPATKDAIARAVRAGVAVLPVTAARITAPRSSASSNLVMRFSSAVKSPHRLSSHSRSRHSSASVRRSAL